MTVFFSDSPLTISAGFRAAAMLVVGVIRFLTGMVLNGEKRCTSTGSSSSS